MPVAFLQTGVAGVLSHVAGRAVDPACAPTCTLYSPSGAVLQAATGATRYTPTTLDDTAVAGGLTVPLTSTAGIVVGERYVIGPNASGQSETVIAHAVTAGESITTRHPLLFGHAAAVAFSSRKLTVAVSAAALAETQKNARARWYYTTNAVAWYEESLCHVSRYAPACTVTEQDILTRSPRARNGLDPRQPLQELVEEVWANEVLSDVAVQWSPESIVSGDALRLATIDRVLAQIALSNGEVELFNTLMEVYRDDLGKAISTAPVDTNDDGDTTNEVAYNIASVRLLRG